MFVEPYDYVRSITVGLATIWTAGGLLRLVRFTREWRDRLVQLGMSREWFNRQVGIMVLRTTLLDPINLALLLILFGIWGLRVLVPTSL